MDYKQKAKEKLINTANEQIAEAEIMASFYRDIAANQGKENAAQTYLKENQVNENIKFNKMFLKFIETYK